MIRAFPPPTDLLSRQSLRTLIGAGILMTAAACSSVPKSGAAARPPQATQAGESLSQASPARHTLASVALAQVGDTYARQSAGPDQYDDTGLTYYAYRQNGRTLPRSLQGQLDAGKPIELATAAPGDLLFFRVDSQNGQGQLTVALLADTRTGVIALPGTAEQGGGVKKINISDAYWQQRLVGVSRVLPSR